MRTNLNFLRIIVLAMKMVQATKLIFNCCYVRQLKTHAETGAGVAAG